MSVFRRFLLQLVLPALATLLVLVPAGQAEPLEKALIVSEAWEGATHADGTGLYWDIIRAVYDRADIQVEHQTVPYIRGVKMVKAGEADAWVGSYIDEEPDVLYPQHHFDADRVYAAFKKGKGAGIDTASDLEGLSLAWVRGYDYDSYLDVPVEKNELSSREAGLKMVQSGRVDALLDAQLEIEEALTNTGLDPAEFDLKEILQLKLYLAFANNDRGKKLRDLFDKHFKALLDSGEIQSLYDKYEWGDFPR